MKGVPSPRVAWYRDESMIEDSPDFRILQKSKALLLLLLLLMLVAAVAVAQTLILQTGNIKRCFEQTVACLGACRYICMRF